MIVRGPARFIENLRLGVFDTGSKADSELALMKMVTESLDFFLTIHVQNASINWVLNSISNTVV